MKPNHLATAQAKVRVSGIKPDQVVGPFNRTHNPPKDRPGLYLRLSDKTGQAVWSYWNGQKWGLYADSKDRAMQRRNKPSKKRLTWFAFKGR